MAFGVNIYALVSKFEGAVVAQSGYAPASHDIDAGSNPDLDVYQLVIYHVKCI